MDSNLIATIIAGAVMLAAIGVLFRLLNFVFTSKTEGAKRMRIVLALLGIGFLGMLAVYSPNDFVPMAMIFGVIAVIWWVVAGFKKDK